MTRLILSIACLISSSAFADAPSTMVNNLLTQGVQVLSLKSDSARNQQMCDLVAKSIDAAYIAPNLLGDYASVSTDQAGVKLFYKELPSLAVSQLIKQAGNGQGAQFQVDSNSTDNGDGTFDVGVTATSGGNTYDADITVVQSGNKFLLRDGSYLGISGVDYLGNEIQKDMASEDPNKPVTGFLNKQMADPNFIQCN
jgi:hypothetical protein